VNCVRPLTTRDHVRKPPLPRERFTLMDAKEELLEGQHDGVTLMVDLEGYSLVERSPARSREYGAVVIVMIAIKFVL